MIISEVSSKEICSTPFNSEAELQELIRKHPSLLKAMSKASGQETEFLIIGKEFGVKSGPIDLLAVDIEGNLYIIETKLAKNPELSDKVIGQIMRYAANLQDTPYEIFKEKCEEYLAKASGKKELLEKRLSEFFACAAEEGSEPHSENEYKKRVEGNLKKGRFNIVVVADDVGLSIQRLFNFLEEKTIEGLNFIVLEINKYELEGKVYLHSNIAWAAQYIRSLNKREIIDEVEFLEDQTPAVRKLIEFIGEWCEKKNLHKKSNQSGLSWRIRVDGGGSVYIAGDQLYTNWGSIKDKSQILTDLAKQKRHEAEKAGFKMTDGGFKIKLEDALSLERVREFLELAYPVLEMAQKADRGNEQ